MSRQIVSWNTSVESQPRTPSPAPSLAPSVVSLDSVLLDDDVVSAGSLGDGPEPQPPSGIPATLLDAPTTGSPGSDSLSAPAAAEDPAFTRHEMYFFEDGNITFLVDNTLFCVHRYFFVRDSSYFAKRLVRLGVREYEALEITISLGDIKRAEFEALLSILYPAEFDEHDRSYEQWKGVLHLSTLWGFASVRRLALASLKPPTPFDQLLLGRAYAVEHYIIPALSSLCERPEPLTLGEVRQMRPEDVVLIASVRESIRSPALEIEPSDIPASVQVAVSHLSGPHADGGALLHTLRTARMKAEAAEREERERAAREARAEAEAEARQRVEAIARVEAEARAKAIAEAEAKARAEFEAKAEAKAAWQEALKAKAAAAAAAAKAMRDEAKARAEAKAEALKAEVDAKAEAGAKAEAEARAKMEAQDRAKAEDEAKAAARAEARARAIAKMEAVAKAKTEAEAKAASAKVDAETKAKLVAEADGKLAAEVKVKEEVERKKARAAEEEKRKKVEAEQRERELQERIAKQRAADKAVRAAAGFAPSPPKAPDWGSGGRGGWFNKLSSAASGVDSIIGGDPQSPQPTEPMSSRSSGNPWGPDPWAKRQQTKQTVPPLAPAASLAPAQSSISSASSASLVQREPGKAEETGAPEP